MRITTAAIVTVATARLTRLITTDDLGRWWVKDPIDRAMAAYSDHAHSKIGMTQGRRYRVAPREPWWWKYRSGLDCPFCVGFWLGAGVLAVERVTRGTALRGPATFAGAALALNYVTGHLEAALGDGHDDDDEDSTDD